MKKSSSKTDAQPSAANAIKGVGDPTTANIVAFCACGRNKFFM